jgi:hypothetical protein
MKDIVKKVFIGSILFFLTVSSVSAQAQSQPERADITITLNEQFFDAFLETFFKNFKPVEFSVAKIKNTEVKFENAAYHPKDGKCSEVVKLEREISGTRTAVRFRDGRILAPLAFSGSYDIPLFGCVDFTGWAETNIELTFDQGKQSLLARVKVVNVNLNGVTGLGSGVLARLLQSSIDKKINPANILNAEKLSFILPLESQGGNLKLHATDMRPEVLPGELKIKIFYELSKAD